MPVKAKPEGYHVVTPYLIAEGAAKVIDFAKAAFGAEETLRFAAPGGRIGHAELRIGDSTVMLADANAGHPAMPCTLHRYVDDADATYRRALAAGAISVQAVANQFYGDRSGGVRDPCGNVWHIATHVEDVPPAEVARRAEEAMRQSAMTGGGITAGLSRAMKQRHRAGWGSAGNPIPL
ncbi:MAG: VOC family protein [Acetobacteraceae bacterium]